MEEKKKPLWKKALNIIIYILVGGVIAFAFFGIVGLQAQVTALEEAVAEQDGDAAEHRRRTARVTETYPWWQAQVKTLQAENEYLTEEVEALRSELEYQKFLMRSHDGSNAANIQENADAIRDLAQRVNGNR